MALVVVLLLLVAMLGVVLAVFSRAQLDRQTSSASAALMQTEVLGDTALELVIGDLLQEIAAGSEVDDFSASGARHREVFQPTLVDTTQNWVGTNVTMSGAPSLVVQRVVANPNDAPRNLVKQSLPDIPFFTIRDGYTEHGDLGEIPSRGSGVSTTDSPKVGRAIPADQWSLPRLASADETLTPPSWIYMNRNGETPTTFDSAMADRDADAYVIGRFAYNIYDVGGLIDINVVGNTLDPEENIHRGRLHQVSLADAPSPLTHASFADFLAWRSAGEESDIDIDLEGGLFDSTRTFTTVRPGSQAFLTRQDLLRYADQTNGIPDGALPFLTTFSRDVNAPSHSPEPNRPMLPLDNPAPGVDPLENLKQINPALTSGRFPSEQILSRGQDPDVTVPAGTPVMVRRFPLSKLSLLSEENPDPETLRYYFGLVKNSDGSFTYMDRINDRIGRFEDVAKLDPPREPNFFEVLQSTVLAGSLGSHARNSYTLDYPRDSQRNLQVLQIGANIIDQWDADDLPTELRYPDPTGGTISSYGIENLPYLNNFAIIPHYPEWDLDRLQLWGVFDVWNPHYNATTPPKDISGFRIRATSGSGRVSLRYELGYAINGKNRRPFGPLFSPYTAGDAVQNILDLNPDRTLTLSPSTDYSEPTIVGGGDAPQSETDRPGFLMWEDEKVPAAVALRPDRSADTQTALNALMEYEIPYSAVIPPVPPQTDGTDAVYSTDPATGDRVYPAGTQVTNLNSTYWTQIPSEPGPADEIRIYANFPAKGFNWFTYTPTSRATFHLEYQGPDGQWRTYQVLNQFMPKLSDISTLKGIADQTPRIWKTDFSENWSPEAPTWWESTHHSDPNFVKTKSFYGWREPGWMVSFFKLDPRTTRFGYSSNYAADALGTTIRTSPAPVPAAISNSSYPPSTNQWRIFVDKCPGLYEPNDPYLDTFGPGATFSWLNLGGPSTERYAAAAFLTNAPDGNLSAASQNFGRYADLDGVTRPADGYLGALPTVPDRINERPVILNRPFRSVGELGYAFRDQPWKTVDFFSRNSGDLGLLDAFSLEEPETSTPVVAGKVNLNSAPPEVLEALLIGGGTHPDLPGETLSQSEAASLSQSIHSAISTMPIQSRGDLVSRVLGATTMNLNGVNTAPNSAGDLNRTKMQREAAIRSLSELGSTRTWNLLVDMVVQSGNLATAADGLSDFIVRAERHYWVHLAIDRLTGEVIAKQTEEVR